MAEKRRKVRLSYPQLKVSVIAELLDDEAPAVCKIVWDMLPLEGKVRHGIYSGREVYILLDNPVQHPPENICQLPLPGELLYFFDGTKSVANSQKPIAEIVVVYNRGVVLRGPEGVPTYCSLFARIPGDWKYDWPEFREGCRKALLEGPPVLKIEKVDG